MNKSSSIAIVGGGAGGVSVFVQLVDRLVALNKRDVKITLIEKDKRVGPGLAYSTTHDSSILNMRFQKMSIFPEKPNDVTEWIYDNEAKLKVKYPAFNPEEDFYPPRSLFGLYLEDTFQEGLNRAKQHGIDTEVVHGTVLNVHDDIRGIRIELEDHESITADKAVLALGNFPPTLYQEFQGIPGYFNSFWPDEKTLTAIDRNKAVCILGTRLTAIDAAITLLENGHKGKIVMASRGGLLPKVKAVTLNPTYKEIIQEDVRKLTSNGKHRLRLDDLINVFRKHIEEATGRKVDWDNVLNPQGTPVELLEEAIAWAKTEDLPWQKVMSSIGDIVEDIWRVLADKDKYTYLEKYDSISTVYRYAMPLKNAEKLLKYLKSGQLEVLGGLQSVIYDETKKQFQTCFSDKKIIETPYLINATEPGLDIAQLDSPLIKNLLKSGMISPNKFGGIDVDFDTCKLIDGKGMLSENLFSIGYLTRGVHFYTNDAGRIAAYAQRVTESITANSLSWTQKLLHYIFS